VLAILFVEEGGKVAAPAGDNQFSAESSAVVHAEEPIANSTFPDIRPAHKSSELLPQARGWGRQVQANIVEAANGE